MSRTHRRGLTPFKSIIITGAIIVGLFATMTYVALTPSPSDVAAEARSKRALSAPPTLNESRPIARADYCLGGVTYAYWGGGRSGNTFIPVYAEGQLKGCEEGKLIPNLQLRCLEATLYYRRGSALTPMLRPDGRGVPCPSAS